MKRLNVLTAISFGALVSFTPLQAKDNKTEQHIGVGTGLIIGALAGGPVGAFIGAAGGAWLGDKVNEAEKVDTLNGQLAQQQLRLSSLQTSLTETSQDLDQAKLLIDDQRVVATKVALNDQLLSGLKVDLMFRTNSGQLEAEALEKMSPLISMLERFPQLELQLTGHGDVLGTDEANKIMAQNRLMSVNKIFLDAGIDQGRIHLLNSGRSQAEAPLGDIDGRALERKVRVQFIPAATSPSLALQ